MELFIELIRGVADGIVTLLQIAMLVRAVVSWFPGGEDSVIGFVAYTISEPVVIPVRKVLEKFESVRNFPIDMSFFVAFMLVSIMSSVFF
ncbi:MAG: YggT family protein [Ruminococcaceae bacterium]|nr:YggT family protein [Oscillospiraceae bacterium]